MAGMEEFEKLSKKVNDLEGIIGKDVCKKLLKFQDKAKWPPLITLTLSSIPVAAGYMISTCSTIPSIGIDEYSTIGGILGFGGLAMLIFGTPIAGMIGENYYKKKCVEFINKFPEKSEDMREYVNSHAKLNGMAFAVAYGLSRGLR
jgi:hypothetical protein